MSTESHTGSRSGQAFQWSSNTTSKKKAYHTRKTSAKVVREVFVGRRMTRSTLNCCKSKSERAKFVHLCILVAITFREWVRSIASASGWIINGDMQYVSVARSRLLSVFCICVIRSSHGSRFGSCSRPVSGSLGDRTPSAFDILPSSEIRARNHHRFTS